ncbi:MAG: hypothetical protein WDW38_000331 [Sanguina aurantia]
MIGGTLPANLPFIFPYLEHLGLDHCSYQDFSSDNQKEVVNTMLSWAQNADEATFLMTSATSGMYPACKESHFVRNGVRFQLSGTIPATRFQSQNLTGRIPAELLSSASNVMSWRFQHNAFMCGPLPDNVAGTLAELFFVGTNVGKMYWDGSKCVASPPPPTQPPFGSISPPPRQPPPLPRSPRPPHPPLSIPPSPPQPRTTPSSSPRPRPPPFPYPPRHPSAKPPPDSSPRASSPSPPLLPLPPLPHPACHLRLECRSRHLSLQTCLLLALYHQIHQVHPVRQVYHQVYHHQVFLLLPASQSHLCFQAHHLPLLPLPHRERHHHLPAHHRIQAHRIPAHHRIQAHPIPAHHRIQAHRIPARHRIQAHRIPARHRIQAHRIPARLRIQAHRIPARHRIQAHQIPVRHRIQAHRIPARHRIQAHRIPARHRIQAHRIPARHRIQAHRIPARHRIQVHRIPTRHLIQAHRIPARHRIQTHHIPARHRIQAHPIPARHRIQVHRIQAHHLIQAHHIPARHRILHLPVIPVLSTGSKSTATQLWPPDPSPPQPSPPPDPSPSSQPATGSKSTASQPATGSKPTASQPATGSKPTPSQMSHRIQAVASQPATGSKSTENPARHRIQVHPIPALFCSGSKPTASQPSHLLLLIRPCPSMTSPCPPPDPSPPHPSIPHRIQAHRTSQPATRSTHAFLGIAPPPAHLQAPAPPVPPTPSPPSPSPVPPTPPQPSHSTHPTAHSQPAGSKHTSSKPKSSHSTHPTAHSQPTGSQHTSSKPKSSHSTHPTAHSQPTGSQHTSSKPKSSHSTHPTAHSQPTGSQHTSSKPKSSHSTHPTAHSQPTGSQHTSSKPNPPIPHTPPPHSQPTGSQHTSSKPKSSHSTHPTAHSQPTGSQHTSSKPKSSHSTHPTAHSQPTGSQHTSSKPKSSHSTHPTAHSQPTGSQHTSSKPKSSHSTHTTAQSQPAGSKHTTSKPKSSHSTHTTAHSQPTGSQHTSSKPKSSHSTHPTAHSQLQPKSTHPTPAPSHHPPISPSPSPPSPSPPTAPLSVATHPTEPPTSAVPCSTVTPPAPKPPSPFSVIQPSPTLTIPTRPSASEPTPKPTYSFFTLGPAQPATAASPLSPGPIYSTPTLLATSSQPIATRNPTTKPKLNHPKSQYRPTTTASQPFKSSVASKSQPSAPNSPDSPPTASATARSSELRPTAASATSPIKPTTVQRTTTTTFSSQVLSTNTIPHPSLRSSPSPKSISSTPTHTTSVHPTTTFDTHHATKCVKLTLPTLTNAPFFVALALPGGIASYCQLCGCAMDYTDPNGNTGSSVNNEHISSYSGGSVASRRSMVASGNTTNLGVVSSLVVDSNTSKIDAAWLVRPDGAGVYSLELTLGTAHMLVQVKVDLTPPTVVGVITEGAQSSSASDPTSTGVSQGSSSQRLLLVTLNFSKPVTVAAGAVTSNTSTILQLISSNSGMVLQVMALGSTGQIASFRMARASYMDAAGNTGATDLDVSLASSKTALSPAATAQVASTASAASAGVAAVIGSSTVVAATAAAGSSFGKAMVSKGSSLQSSFHLQMLAMSSQLASPGIGDSYRMIAKYFRWTMLGVRGSVPVLDGLFSNSAKNVSAVTAAQNSDPGFWPSVTVASPPPPSTSSNTTSSSRRRVLLVEPSTPPLSHPPPLPQLPNTSSSSNSSSSDQSAAALQAWLLTHGADTTKYIAASTSVPTTSSGSSSGTLSIVAASSGASSSSGSSGNSSSAILQGSGLVLVVTTQELLYTLAIAGLLMVALTLLRSALAFLYLRYVDPSLLAQFLEFPRLEAMAAGALIMALTFNASVALVGPESDWRSSKTAAVLVLSVVTLPYTAFLWWLTLGRIWKLPERSKAFSSLLHPDLSDTQQQQQQQQLKTAPRPTPQQNIALSELLPLPQVPVPEHQPHPVANLPILQPSRQMHLHSLPLLEPHSGVDRELTSKPDTSNLTNHLTHAPSGSSTAPGRNTRPGVRQYRALSDPDSSQALSDPDPVAVWQQRPRPLMRQRPTDDGIPNPWRRQDPEHVGFEHFGSSRSDSRPSDESLAANVEPSEALDAAAGLISVGLSSTSSLDEGSESQGERLSVPVRMPSMGVQRKLLQQRLQQAQNHAELGKQQRSQSQPSASQVQSTPHVQQQQHHQHQQGHVSKQQRSQSHPDAQQHPPPLPPLPAMQQHQQPQTSRESPRLSGLVSSYSMYDPTPPPPELQHTPPPPGSGSGSRSGQTHQKRPSSNPSPPSAHLPVAGLRQTQHSNSMRGIGGISSPSTLTQQQQQQFSSSDPIASPPHFLSDPEQDPPALVHRSPSREINVRPGVSDLASASGYHITSGAVRVFPSEANVTRYPQPVSAASSTQPPPPLQQQQQQDPTPPKHRPRPMHDESPQQTRTKRALSYPVALLGAMGPLDPVPKLEGLTQGSRATRMTSMHTGSGHTAAADTHTNGTADAGSGTAASPNPAAPSSTTPTQLTSPSRPPSNFFARSPAAMPVSQQGSVSRHDAKTAWTVEASTFPPPATLSIANSAAGRLSSTQDATAAPTPSPPTAPPSPPFPTSAPAPSLNPCFPLSTLIPKPSTSTTPSIIPDRQQKTIAAAVATPADTAAAAFITDTATSTAAATRVPTATSTGTAPAAAAAATVTPSLPASSRALTAAAFLSVSLSSCHTHPTNTAKIVTAIPTATAKAHTCLFRGQRAVEEAGSCHGIGCSHRPRGLLRAGTHVRALPNHGTRSGSQANPWVLELGSKPDSSSGTVGVRKDTEKSLADWLLPSEGTLARFEFIFEDVLGCEPALKGGRERSWILIAAALNFTHKVTCAVIFGVFGLLASSWPQLAILSALQALMLGYLILARPYLEWQLMALEVAAHTCELALFTAAMASMMLPDSFAITLSMMGTFFLCITLLLIYELRTVIVSVQQSWTYYCR